HEEMQNYDYGYSVSEQQQFVGEFTGNVVNGLAEVDVKNKFTVGDHVEMMTPQGNINFTITEMSNKKGEKITTAPGNGYFVYLAIPDDIALDYALLMRNLTNTTTRNPY